MGKITYTFEKRIAEIARQTWLEIGTVTTLSPVLLIESALERAVYEWQKEEKHGQADS